MQRFMGRIGYAWGLGAIVLAILDALVRLTPIGIEAFAQPLAGRHWAVLVVWLVFMVIVEGYRGFHRSFSPRVIARAEYLLEHPRWIDVVLAPFFFSSLYRTTRRRLVASWSMVTGIVSVVVLVRTVAQPWRGLVDLGVVGGLSVGLFSMVVWFVRARRGEVLPYSPELGEGSDTDEKAATGRLSQAPIP